MKSLDLSPEELNELFNYAIEIKSGKVGEFNIDKISAGMASRAISSLEGLFKGKSKRVKVDKDKREKLKRLYSKLRNWFEPEIDTDKEIGMKKTAGYLKKYAESRTFLSHNKKIEDLHEILKGVDCGVRYLRHINKRFQQE